MDDIIKEAEEYLAENERAWGQDSAESDGTCQLISDLVTALKTQAGNWLAGIDERNVAKVVVHYSNGTIWDYWPEKPIAKTGE